MMAAEGALRASQRTRRSRIIGSAVRLAASGGYDAVQMREVAADSKVALGTLYRYFPSKDHLLASAMLDAITAMGERLVDRPPQGRMPADRVIDVLGRSTRGMLRQGNLTAAMLRALVSGDSTLAPVVREVRGSMSRIITEAMHPGEPTEREVAAARVLEYVWMGSLVGWLNGALTGPQVTGDLETAANLLIGG